MERAAEISKQFLPGNKFFEKSCRFADKTCGQLSFIPKIWPKIAKFYPQNSPFQLRAAAVAAYSIRLQTAVGKRCGQRVALRPVAIIDLRK